MRIVIVLRHCGREKQIWPPFWNMYRVMALSILGRPFKVFGILHFGLWLEGDYHNTIGRFDKIMYPYLKADMETGIIFRRTALELVKDFFLSFNKDSDLYPGVQQGNNGQSMMLGGIDADGGEVNAEQMKDAQLHPENHQQLIVRIWGWSAYFVELDREYQDHVIARQEYTV